MKRNKGFTLIELVIVIIVLGILSATAVPKFINLQTDAKNAALKGMVGAIDTANTLVYSKLAIVGKETQWQIRPDEAKTIIDGCDTCTFFNGYITPDKKTLSVMIDGINVNDTGDFVVSGFNGSAEDAFVYITNPKNINSGKLVNESCYIKYSMKTTEKIRPTLEIKQCQ